MKKALLSIICFISVYSSFCQDEEEIGYRDRCVILKWAPGSLVAGKVTVGGEYNFKKKNSLELFLGFPAAANHHFDYDNNTSTLSSQAFSVLFGYRYYLGRKPNAGFYVEPYFKHLHHQASGFLIGDLNGESAKFDTHTDYKGTGVGLQLGVQFLIVKRVSLDFFLLGPEANLAKFECTATDVASSIPWTLVEANEAEQDIKDAIKDIPIVGDKVEVQVDQNTKTVTARYSGFLPGLRLGASVGFRL